MLEEATCSKKLNPLVAADEEIEIVKSSEDSSESDLDVGEDDDVMVEDGCFDLDSEWETVAENDLVAYEDEAAFAPNPTNEEDCNRTPRKGDDLVVESPTVGMVFPSWDHVNNYYRSYGKQSGFGVVCVGGGKPVKNEEGQKKCFYNYVWKCECYGRTSYRRKVNGKRITLSEEPLVKKKSKKCNCPVMMYASRNKQGEWVIKKAVNDHKNHNPTPRKSQHIPMYKKENITKLVEFRIENDYDAGDSIPQIYNNLANQRNGVENIGFNKKDMYNIVNRKTRLKLRGGDAAAMLEYFNKMTEDNQNFFHMHRLDDTGKLKDVMWVDARSRAAYEYFGDVVCFDSTYLTNEYMLPFSNFVGVNHHGQTILLGCALVSHEDAETFVWLFKTWMMCMGGKPPGAIMTDQDAAMRKAIGIALPMPETRHRWCMWHIMKKFGAKLGSLSNYKEVKVVLQNIIYNSITPDEFVQKWTAAMTDHDLLTKECYTWLDGLFQEREMWIPAYLKHLFWGGMQTTQRVESINSFFDGYLKKHTRLFQFAPRYCKAMESRSKDEQEADANASRFVRPLMTEFFLERKFQKLYTDAKFVEVQTQCTRVMYLIHVEEKQIAENVVSHVFSDRVWIWSKFLKREIPLGDGTVKRNYTVTFNKINSVAKCDCKHFECHGIVCCHIVKVFDMYTVTEVPAYYILDRWRKDIQRKHTRVKVAYHNLSKTEEVKRYDKLMIAFEPVVLRAITSDDSVDILMELIQLMVVRLDERQGKTESGGDAPGPSSVGNVKTSGRNGQSSPPQTPCSVNKDVQGTHPTTPCSINMERTTSSPETTVKDPIPRGKKPQRTPDIRYVSPAENPKTARKPRTKKKVVQNTDNEEEDTHLQTPTNTANQQLKPKASRKPRGKKKGVDNATTEAQDPALQAPITSVNQQYTLQHQVFGHVVPMQGVAFQQHQFVGALPHPQHHHMVTAMPGFSHQQLLSQQLHPIHRNGQSEATHQLQRVHTLATNMFPATPLEYSSLGGIQMSANVDSLQYFTRNSHVLQGVQQGIGNGLSEDIRMCQQ